MIFQFKEFVSQSTVLQLKNCIILINSIPNSMEKYYTFKKYGEVAQLVRAQDS